MERKIKFTLFSDLHYKKRMYASTVADLEAIIDRAHASGSELILHAGDFCNDYKGSKEIVDAFLSNRSGLPAYGIYGNHELETPGNTMEFVTPRLSNRPVVYGTPDGSFSPEIGYYHFDMNGFRFVCLDTNYSYFEEKWVHNLPASWGPPNGAGRTNALGPDQVKWLEKTLIDAEKNDLLCVLVSHADFTAKLSQAPSYDWTSVREIIKKVNSEKKTVVLAINGHYHTDHLNEIDGVFYLDCNTVRNGFWYPTTGQHYLPGQTFDFQDYDENGNPTKLEKLDLCSLSQAKNTWFSDSPQSAVITLSESALEIEGSSADWMYGVIPESLPDGKRPGITSHHITF